MQVLDLCLDSFVCKQYLVNIWQCSLFKFISRQERLHSNRLLFLQSPESHDNVLSKLSSFAN